MTNLLLFWEFFKTGLLSIGGGMATLPFLFNISSKTGWYTTAELADMVAVSESTPGPIGVNMATYVGYKVNGILGSLIATMGLVLPSLIIIVIIASIFDKFSQKPIVKFAFLKLRAAVIALIGFAVYQLAVVVFLPVGKLTVLFASFYIICLFINLKCKKIHPIFIVLLGALFGILFC